MFLERKKRKSTPQVALGIKIMKEWIYKNDIPPVRLGSLFLFQSQLGNFRALNSQPISFVAFPADWFRSLGGRSV